MKPQPIPVLPRITFRDCDDQQLWGVIGKDWQIPVFFRPCRVAEKEYGYIWAALGLTQDQSQALVGRMDAVPHRRASPGWLVDRPLISLIARRIQGVTPSKHLKWPANPATEPIEESGPPVQEGPSPERAYAFLRYVQERTGIADMTVLTMVWAAICNCIGRWLMEGKPIDFGGLFTINAMPLRRNWLELLLGRMPGLRRVYLSGQHTELLRLMFTTASRWLRCPEMAEIRFRGLHPVTRWNLFIANGATWNELSDERERHVLTSLGSHRYLRRWANLIGSLEEHLHRTAAQKVAEEDAPCGRIEPGRPGSPASLCRGSATQLSPQEIVDSDPRGGLSVDDLALDEHATEDLEKAAAKLLGLPTAQPRVLDMRHAWRNGANKPTGTPGMLVLPATRGQAPQETVLPRPQQPAPRLG